MSNTNSNQFSQVTRYQNAALNYYLGLTNSSYLHYGYWHPLPVSSEELTLPQFRKAQQAYAEKLFSFIPPQINTVLDVGCGIGGNAAYLLKQGFKVEGLAPDPFQQEKFLENTHQQAKFHLTKFEDFKGNNTYDLILLSESSQYMAANDIAQCSAKLLNSGGYVLLADMMRSDPTYKEGIFSNCHVVEELHTALIEAGFTLIKSEDISAEIAPTIDLYIDSFRTWGLSTIKYVADLISIAVPPLYQVLRWIYKRWIKKLVVEGLEAKQLYEKHLCYQIQLWQLLEKDK